MNSASVMSRFCLPTECSVIYPRALSFERFPSRQHTFSARGELVGVGAAVLDGDIDELLVREVGERLIEPALLQTHPVVCSELGTDVDPGGSIKAGEDGEDVSLERREAMKDPA